jgi:hypothetical protein
MPNKECKRVIFLIKHNEIQKNINKWLNKIRKTKLDINEKFSKQKKTLKKNQMEIFGMKNTISQIKIQLKALTAD